MNVKKDMKLQINQLSFLTFTSLSAITRLNLDIFLRVSLDDILGEDGASLKDKWDECPAAYLGIISTGFPNMFIAGGPHNTTSFCNIPRCIEHNVEWITDCIRYMESRGLRCSEAEAQAEQAWGEQVNAIADQTIFPSCNSWYLGANIPGKPRVFMPFLGFSDYVTICDQVSESGYSGFDLV